MSYDAIALRRDLFWHLMRTAGYDPQRLSQLLSGVLTDIDCKVTDAQLWVGDITDEEFAAPRPMDQDTGLTETQRLELCQRVVIEQPKQAPRVGASDRPDDMVPPMYTQFMAAQLDQLWPRLTKHLPIANPDLTEVVQSVRWWQQARTQTPLPAVFLDVRALEVIASRVGRPGRNTSATTWAPHGSGNRSKVR